MDKRRVAITGLGWVTSFGNDVDQVFKRMIAGESGIKPITRFDASTYATRFCGEVNEDNVSPLVPPRDVKRLDRFAKFALNASIAALEDSGLTVADEDPWRFGSIIGSGIGGIEEFETGYTKMMTKGHERVSPFMVPKLMVNAGSGNVSIYFGIKGPNSAIATACASAGHAIGAAADAIRYGQADIMFTGGSEAACTPLGVACFIALRALSTRNDSPAEASRPWDKDRDGFVMGEGAGILVLEEMERARKRGAKIYAELLGYGQSADGSHITAPDERGRGASTAMNNALADSGINKEQVQYVNAHGTSTELGDVAEVRAIKGTFNSHAQKLQISSTKSMTGHLLGASGGIEAVIAAKAIDAGTLPPTINLHQPAEECDLDFIPNEARDADVSIAMSNSFGFGGHNVSLVFGKV